MHLYCLLVFTIAAVPLHTRCEDEETEKDPGNEDECIPITDCSIPVCVNGHCVILDDGTRVCYCYDGWSGQYCNNTGPEALSAVATLSTGATVSIVVAIIAVLREYRMPVTCTSIYSTCISSLYLCPLSTRYQAHTNISCQYTLLVCPLCIFPIKCRKTLVLYKFVFTII